MAIGTKKKRILAAESKDFPRATTHFDNDTTKPVEESGQAVKNQQEWNDILIDPDDTNYGNTHFRNEDDKPDDKSKGNPPVTAKRAHTAATTKESKRIDALLAANRLTASDLREDDFGAAEYTKDGVPSAGEDKNATFPAGGVNSGTGTKASAKAKKKVKAAETQMEDPEADEEMEICGSEENCDDQGSQADTHFPNGDTKEPTDGYLTVGELEDMEEDSEFDDADEDELEAGVADLEEPAGQAPQQSLLDATDEYEDELHADLTEFEHDEAEPHAEGEPEEVEDEALGDEGPELATADEMDLVDVDGEDDEGDDVVFASIGLSLKAIKGNRIIASLGKKRAIKAGVGDEYLSDEFSVATSAEMAKHGMRAGLAKQGFAMAKVNVARNETLNRRVELKAKQVTAAVRRNQASSNEALGQCLAIAAVGINRQYFKDTRNELRAALEDELEAAGVRQASRLVRRVFASKGIDYAKSILTLANKLVNMPEETRNAFASALDMTTGELDEGEDEDTFGDSSVPDFQGDDGMDDEVEGGDDDFVDTFEEEESAPETIHAALRSPARNIRKTSVNAGTYSPTAQAILSGTWRG
jgi:hypothetical protein